VERFDTPWPPRSRSRTMRSGVYQKTTRYGLRRWASSPAAAAPHGPCFGRRRLGLAGSGTVVRETWIPTSGSSVERDAWRFAAVLPQHLGRTLRSLRRSAAAWERREAVMAEVGDRLLRLRSERGPRSRCGGRPPPDFSPERLSDARSGDRGASAKPTRGAGRRVRIDPARSSATASRALQDYA